MTEDSFFQQAKAAIQPLIPQRFRRDAAIVPVVRLTGAIGVPNPLRPGMTLAGVA